MGNTSVVNALDLLSLLHPKRCLLRRLRILFVRREMLEMWVLKVRSEVSSPPR